MHRLYYKGVCTRSSAQSFEMWSKIFVALIVLVCASTQAGIIDPTCVNNLNGKFQLLGSPFPVAAIPLATDQASSESIKESQLTRYHIIPRTTLLPFFGEALSDEKWRPQFVQFLQRLVAKAEANNMDFSGHGVDDALNRTTSLLPADSNGAFDGPLRLLWLLFCWMPFNFFIGPSAQLRSDYMANDWEINAERVVGDAVFADVKLLRDSMTSFNGRKGDMVP